MISRLILCVIFLIPAIVRAQDSSSLYNKVYNLPDKFFGAAQKKSEKFQRDFVKSTNKYLNKLSRQELKMQRKLARKDSVAAREIFGDVNKKYADMRAGLSNPPDKLQKLYSPHLDSMKTGLSFLNQNKVLEQSSGMQGKLKDVLKDYEGVQEKLNYSDFLQRQLTERQDFLKNKLRSLGFGKSFTKLKENVYYYRAQVDEYRNIFEKPEKIETLLLGAVSKLPAFKDFFAKYSQLGSIFQLPGNDNMDMSALNGMQTREVLMQELGQRLGSGPSTQNLVGDNISSAQTSLRSIKEKLNGQQSNCDPEMPNFKPNMEKTKSFFQRIEIGTNLQSTKSNYFFPQTTDLAVIAGYKFKPNIIAGLGMSYGLGLGRDFRHIAISHQGIGFRSYGEMKLKGSFWITAGAELNYRSEFKNFEELKDHGAWQKSLLSGLNKKYAVKNKLKGSIQLLYDFLYRQKQPAGSPVIFRVGYNLK